MGYALAEAAVEAGAKVTLISGPVSLSPPPRVKLEAVISAQQMYESALRLAPVCDIYIASAAVADYSPLRVAPQKIKSSPDTMRIELKKTLDIVAAVAAIPDKPYTVGFAAETQDLISYAQNKLKNKKLDMIVANDVSTKGIGFDSDDNAVTLIWPERSINLEQSSKRQIARQIITAISQQINLTKKINYAKTSD